MFFLIEVVHKKAIKLRVPNGEVEIIHRKFYGRHHKLVDRYGITVFTDYTGYVPNYVVITITFPCHECDLPNWTIYRVCNNTTGGTNGAESAYPSGALPPSKPDNILLVNIQADSSLTTPESIKHSTAIQFTTVTSIETDTLSTLQTPTQNDTNALKNSALPITDHNTTLSTPSNEVFSSDITYSTTTSYTEQTTTTITTTTTKQDIVEGDNITIVCSGNVGNPPANHFYQKYRSGHSLSITYKASETLISYISENCSYYRTSYLTFQVTADDNHAVIRCVVNSSMADPDMYKETAPIEVYSEVSLPTIKKFPNKPYYVVGEDTSINLTCKSDGNPKLHYQWYKENHYEFISTKEILTIIDINVTNSGVYICKVSNTFNGYTYRNATNVRIDVMDKGLIVGIIVGVVIIIVFMIVIVAWRRATSKFPTSKNESKSYVDSELKPVPEFGTGNYDYIALEDDANKTQKENTRLDVEDISKHNKEYLNKQEEEEKKKNKSNTPPQSAVYAQVNEATKSKKKQKSEVIDSVGKQEEDTYAETQEGIYDKAGERRHRENKNNEHYDSSNNSSNGDTSLSIQGSQIGSKANRAFENDANRKVPTMPPTLRSSGSSQNDEKTNPSLNNHPKSGYNNTTGSHQTGTLEKDLSHQTAL